MSNTADVINILL